MIKKLAFMDTEEFELIPESRIKSPGALLKLVKTESAYTTPRNTPRASPRIQTMMSTPRGDSSAGIDGLRPLKASSADSEPSYTLSLAFQKILNRNNVSLRSSLAQKQTVAAVASIIEELNELPYTFVKKLNLKIILTDNADAERYWFNSRDLQSQERIVDKLYMQMFYCLLKQYPDVVRLWKQDIPRYSTQTSLDTDLREKIENTERAFYALMLNKEYPKSKVDVTNLKDLLIRFDSIGFSAEWFKSRNRYLRRGFKVRFDSNVNENIFSHCKRVVTSL